MKAFLLKLVRSVAFWILVYLVASFTQPSLQLLVKWLNGGFVALLLHLLSLERTYAFLLLFDGLGSALALLAFHHSRRLGTAIPSALTAVFFLLPLMLFTLDQLGMDADKAGGAGMLLGGLLTGLLLLAVEWLKGRKVPPIVEQLEEELSEPE